jgi:hypothetical protein
MFFLPTGLPNETQQKIFNKWKLIKTEQQEREKIKKQKEDFLKSLSKRKTFSFKSMMILNYYIQQEKKLDKKYNKTK